MTMNKDWQKAHDETPGGAGAGVQHMYDAIAAAPQTEQGRKDAALAAFADNTLALVGTDVPIDTVKQLLQHTLKHFDGKIAHSVRHGHKQD